MFSRSVLVGGKYRLSIEFSGVLDDSLRGFYRTKHIVQGEVQFKVNNISLNMNKSCSRVYTVYFP